MLITSGLCIIGSNGPKTGTLRAARNSSAAFFCSAVYCSGAIVGRRCWASAGPATSNAQATRAHGANKRSMGAPFVVEVRADVGNDVSKKALTGRPSRIPGLRKRGRIPLSGGHDCRAQLAYPWYNQSALKIPGTVAAAQVPSAGRTQQRQEE